MTIPPLLTRISQGLRQFFDRMLEPSRRRFNLWLLVTISLVLMTGLFVTNTILDLQTKGKASTEIGQRIVIDVQTGRITSPFRGQATLRQTVGAETTSPEVLSAGSANNTSEGLHGPMPLEVVGPPLPTKHTENIPQDGAIALETEIKQEASPSTEPLALDIQDQKPVSPPRPSPNEKKTDTQPLAPVTPPAAPGAVPSVLPTTSTTKLELADGELPDLTPNHFTHKIAVILRNLGLKQEATATALKFPKETTFAFSVYAPNLSTLIKDSQKAGHPLLLELPMDDALFPYSDPGPQALLRNSSPQKNLFRLQSILQLGGNIHGLIGADNEAFTGHNSSIEPILDHMQRNDVFFIFQQNDGNKFVTEQAQTVGLNFIPGYHQLDRIATRESMMKKMKEIYELINQNEVDIVIAAETYPLSLELLSKLLADLAAAGYSLSDPYTMGVTSVNLLKSEEPLP